MSQAFLIDAPGRKIGYARVSTKDQKLDLQRDALEAAGCDRIFEDHAVSGKHARRPGLDAMLRELNAGDTLIVFKLDRLGRSVLHLADLLAQLEENGIHFCSMSEGINTTTPGGKLIFYVFAAVAQFQREIIVENTMAGLEAARLRGAQLGRPRTVSSEVLALAQRMIALEGQSVAAVARDLKLNRITLARALKREMDCV